MKYLVTIANFLSEEYLASRLFNQQGTLASRLFNQKRA